MRKWGITLTVAFCLKKWNTRRPRPVSNYQCPLLMVAYGHKCISRKQNKMLSKLQLSNAQPSPFRQAVGFVLVVGRAVGCNQFTNMLCCHHFLYTHSILYHLEREWLQSDMCQKSSRTCCRPFDLNVHPLLA